MKRHKLSKLSVILSILLSINIFIGCTDTSLSNENKTDIVVRSGIGTQEEKSESEKIDTEKEELKEENNQKAEKKGDIQREDSKEKDEFEGYKLIEVNGGDLSGHREANVVVDIGFGDREYYAFTNEYGQLVKVIAKKIILQDDSTEPVNSKGRYYSDEAKVPGVESSTLDEGHVIADSLGGVSNAYNITPQNSTLNRHGDQAYMEDAIRKAGGAADFLAIITYPSTTTQIPSHYSYTYTIKGNVVKEEFDNINPDEYNANLSENNSNVSTKSDPVPTPVQTPAPIPEKIETPIVNESVSNGEVVYWTPNGKSYHTTSSCSTLSRSKTILQGTIAESGKFDPCDICH